MPSKPKYHSEVNATLAAIISDFDRQRSLSHVLIQKAKDRTEPAEVRVLIANLTLINTVSLAEETIRQLSSAYLLLLQRKVRYSYYLPEEIKSKTMKALAFVVGRPDEVDWSDAGHLHSALQMMQSRLSRPAFLIEDMVRNQSNFTSKFLSDYLKGVGVRDIWSVIAQEYIRLSDEAFGSVDTCKSAIVDRWNELIEERNNVVHRLGIGTGWRPERVEQAAEFSGVVLQGVSNGIGRDCCAVISKFHRGIRWGMHNG